VPMPESPKQCWKSRRTSPEPRKGGSHEKL
jgi:hypothetical protein